MKLEQEMELKFDVHADMTDETVIYLLDQLFAQTIEHSPLGTKHEHELEFSFYDDENLTAFNHGWTIRIVKSNDDGYNVYKSKFRFDFKTGEAGTPERMESSTGWTNHNWHVYASQDWKHPGITTHRKVTATARTKHTRWELKGQDDDGVKQRIEICFDRFYHPDGTLMFREIEIEVLAEDDPRLEQAAKKLTELFKPEHLTPINVQKYNRVLLATLHKRNAA